MKGVLVLIAVNSEYTPSVCRREHDENVLWARFEASLRQVHSLDVKRVADLKDFDIFEEQLKIDLKELSVAPKSLRDVSREVTMRFKPSS